MQAVPQFQQRRLPLQGKALQRCLLVIYCIHHMLPTPAFAEDELDWRACVAIAQGKNPDLLARKQAEIAAQQQLSLSRSAFLPQVSASASSEAAKFANRSTSIQTSDQTQSLGLSIRQSLFSGFRDQSRIEQKQAEIEVTRLETAHTSAKLAYDLRVAFDQMLYLQKLVILNRQAIDRRSENVKLVALRYEGGREHKGSVLKSQAKLSQAKLELAQSERGLQAAQSQLIKALGQAPSSRISLRGDLRVVSHPEKTDADIGGQNASFTAIANQDVAVQQAVASVKAASAAVRVARSQYYPDLSATAGASRQGTNGPLNEDRLSLSLTLTVPIYNGGSTDAETATAVAELSKAQAAELSAKNNALLSTIESYNGLINAVEKVAVQHEVADANGIEAEISRNQYTLGIVSFQDWDQVESDLISSRKAELDSRRDASLALANWEKVLDKKLDEVTP